jgi:ABC-type antimicrobial peptide transport system ATPase subunit
VTKQIAHKLTANECAHRFFVRAARDKRKEVSNIELQTAVARRTGQSRATVSGTLDTSGCNTLLESPWYTASWHKEKRGHHVVHVRNRIGVRTKTAKLWDYDTASKRGACQRIVAYLPTTGIPRLLTLACCHGNCVKAARARNLYTLIDSVEKRHNVLM